MTDSKARKQLRIVAFTSAFIVSSCAVLDGTPSEPLDAGSTPDDIPDGPGLITGEQGSFGWEHEFGKDKDKKTEEADASGEQPAASDPARDTTQDTTREAAPTATVDDRRDAQARELDRQIKELERQRQELEALKEELRQILDAAPKAR